MGKKTTLRHTQTTLAVFDIIKTGISFRPRNSNESRKKALAQLFAAPIPRGRSSANGEQIDLNDKQPDSIGATRPWL